PLEQVLAIRHVLAVAHEQDRAVRRVVALARAAGLVQQLDLAAVSDDDAERLGLRRRRRHPLHELDLRELQLARALRRDARGLDDTAGRAADVERAQRELRARLAERLR